MMYKNLFTMCAVAGAMLMQVACTNTPNPEPKAVNIIPLPRSMTMMNGQFILKDGMSICYSDTSLKPAAN